MTMSSAKEIAIAWRNLHYQTSSNSFSGKLGENTVTILQPISGHFEVGSLNAILGPSGSVRVIFCLTKQTIIFHLFIKRANLRC